MRKRVVLVLICVLVTALTAIQTASAKTFIPYRTYEYNSYDESVSAPAGYEPEGIYSGEDLGVGALLEPQDLMFFGDLLFVLDSGNSRIVVLDSEMKVNRIIPEFKQNGESVTFNKANGLFVTANGNILVADTEGQRILEADSGGEIIRIIEKPDTQLLTAEREFKVIKVLQDENERIYALVTGINEGALVFTKDGDFAGFFGSNEVRVTAQVILEQFWQNFMTEQQIRNSKSYTPKEFTNFDFNSKGFIYTVTQSKDTDKGKNSVRAINFKGDNLQEKLSFGDLEWDRKLRNSVYTAFVDICIDENDTVFLLDSSRGRVFSYSKSGRLISVFGTLGDQLGTFKSAKAIENHNGKIYVLDDLRGAITVFEPNDYAKTVNTALKLHDSGEYSQAMEYWEKVRKMNTNSEMASFGIGLALDESRSYKEALPYFKLANEHKAYSDAFTEVRKDFIKNNFPLLLSGLIAVTVGIILALRFLRKKFARESAYVKSSLERKYTAPLFTALHPIDGFENLKLNNSWSIRLCVGILLTLFLNITASWYFTGFTFNLRRAVDFNVLIILVQSFGVVAVWVIANWAVCTLIEGKGKFKDIFCTTVYALLPFIVSMFIAMILSNVFVFEEQVFLTLIQQAGILWSAILILCGFCSIHQFSFGKTILSVVMTFLGMAIIAFLLIMFFSLIQQVYNFIKSIVSEIQMLM